MLLDVVVIRDILVVLLVFYHAFAIFSGGWEPIEGYPSIPFYWWLDKLSYSFLLELFVFISGYLFGYQVRVKGVGKLQAKDLFLNKFQRLIVPCIIFSLLYIAVFLDIKQPLYKTAYDVFNGVGHMWFLPMLFWCFVGIWIIEKLQLKPKLVIPILIVAALFSISPIPFRIGKAMYYLVFFYSGYILQKDSISLSVLYTRNKAILFLICFSILFFSLTCFKENLNEIVIGGGGIFSKIINLALNHVCKILYSSSGIVLMLSLSGLYVKHFKVSQRMITLGGLSFGVYLIQQFVLKYVYYKTELPCYLSPYVLPWVGFIFTLIVSVALSYLLIKTRVGRYLIG